MKVERTHTDGIIVPQRLRALDRTKVTQLAESMAAIGLLQPITVFMSSEYEATLVAGAHRLAAAIELGWDGIDAVFLEGWSDIDRQLVEIDENLMRAELSPTQQAEHLEKRKELWEARQVAQVAPVESRRADGKGHNPEGFAAATSKTTGVSKANVNRAIARAKKVPQDVRDRIKGTKLDTGAYLDSLKPLSPEQMHIRVTRDLASYKTPTSPKSSQDIEAERRERWRTQFCAHWERGAAEDQQWAREWLEDQEAATFDLTAIA